MTNMNEAQKLLEEHRFDDVVHLAAKRLKQQVAVGSDESGGLLPLDQLLWTTVKIYSLIRKRELRKANEEVTALGNLDQPSYCFEFYPQHYAPLRGSMVPFSLRLVAACLSLMLSRSNSVSALDCLYALHHWTSAQAASSTAPQWTSKRILTAHLLAEYHMSQDQYNEALMLLQEILTQQPEHVATLALMGRVCLGMGAIDSAEECFGLVQCLAKDEQPIPTTETNSGLLHMSKGDYAAARQHFETAASLRSNTAGHTSAWPTRALSKFPEPASVENNNLAVASLYCSDLYEATMHLERLLMKDTVGSPFSTAVKNLVMLYEFSSNKPQCLHCLTKALVHVSQDADITAALGSTM